MRRVGDVIGAGAIGAVSTFLVVAAVSDGSATRLMGILFAVAGALWLALAPLAYADRDGFGTAWARRTPGGSRADAKTIRAMTRWFGVFSAVMGLCTLRFGIAYALTP